MRTLPVSYRTNNVVNNMRLVTGSSTAARPTSLLATGLKARETIVLRSAEIPARYTFERCEQKIPTLSRPSHKVTQCRQMAGYRCCDHPGRVDRRQADGKTLSTFERRALDLPATQRARKPHLPLPNVTSGDALP